MNETMSRLLDEARHNPALRDALLKTREAEDPMDAFCKGATENGYPLTVGEVFEAGEQFIDDVFCSCNGRAEEPIAEWADAYETFFAALVG